MAGLRCYLPSKLNPAGPAQVLLSGNLMQQGKARRFATVRAVFPGFPRESAPIVAYSAILAKIQSRQYAKFEAE